MVRKETSSCIVKIINTVEPLIVVILRKGHCIVNLSTKDTGHGPKLLYCFGSHTNQTSEKRGQPLYKGQNPIKCPLFKGATVDSTMLPPLLISSTCNLLFRYSNHKAFMQWQLLNGRSFVFARTDWEYVLNTFSFGYAIGYHFIESADGSCNGNFLGIGQPYIELAYDYTGSHLRNVEGRKALYFFVAITLFIMSVCGYSKHLAIIKDIIARVQHFTAFTILPLPHTYRCRHVSECSLHYSVSIDQVTIIVYI